VVNRAVASLNTRMETEREARLKASTDMLCNMDQAELSEKLLDLCLNKYLDYEQNRFDKLAEDPAMTRDGARMIVQMHKHLTAGLEQALRMS
jgi:hypothetical protein